MSSFIERDLLVKDPLDRIEALEREMRRIQEHASTPQDPGLTAANPEYSDFTGWIVTGSVLQDWEEHIKLDSTVPKIEVGTGGTVQLGNLNGLADYSTDAYGIFLGDYASDKWLSYDPTNSLRIRGDAIVDGTIAAVALDTGIGALMFATDGLFLMDFQKIEYDGANWNTIGSRGEKGRIIGAIHHEQGRWMGTRGLYIEEGTTNLAENPSFEVNVTDFWTAVSNGTKTRVTTDYVYGDACCELEATAAATVVMNSATGAAGIAVTSGNDYSLTGYLKVLTGSTVGARVRVRWYEAGGAYISQDLGNVVNIGQGFQRSVVTATAPTSPVAAFASVQVTLPSAAIGDIAYVDGVQFEEKDYPTSYCDGAQGQGYAWSGTAHDSTSTRTATEVRLDNYSGVLSGNDTMSIAVWFQVKHDYDDGPATNWNIAHLYDVGTTGEIQIWYDPGTPRFRCQLNDGADSTTLTDTVTSFSAGDQFCIVVTADFDNAGAGDYKMYINGVVEDTDVTANIGAPTLTEFNIGSSRLGAAQANCVVSQFAVFDDILTANEVAQLYALQRPLVDLGPVKRPGVFIIDGEFRLASSLTGERIVIDSGGMEGYDSAGTLQVAWYSSGDNAGEVVAGAGAVTMKSSGIEFDAAASYGAGKWITFIDGATDTAYIEQARLPGPSINVLRLGTEAVETADWVSLEADQVIVSGTPNTVYAATATAEFVVNGDIAIPTGGICIGSSSVNPDTGAIHFAERSSDPAEPAEGTAVIWMSDGTGKSDDGDICAASQAGGTTNWGVLFDHSAGAAW